MIVIQYNTIQYNQNFVAAPLMIRMLRFIRTGSGQKGRERYINGAETEPIQSPDEASIGVN